jgi:hypothetical protein
MRFPHTLSSCQRSLYSALNANLLRRRPTLPHRCQCSTIGAGGLNCRVRDGNGCNPSANVTGKPLPVTGRRSQVQVFQPATCNLRPVTSHFVLSDNDRLESFKQGKFYGQASRPISTGKLHALPRFHTQPITWWSSRGLQHPRGWGYLISRWVSRLYAFSVYPFQT